MGSRWLSNAMWVVGKICALTSGFTLAEKSYGEQMLEMYLKIIGEGVTVGGSCTGYLTDDKKTIPKSWVPWAGWSAANMEKRLREEGRGGNLDLLFRIMKLICQDQIDKKDRCLLKDALVCDEKKGQCVSCRESMEHFDCENAIEIADAEKDRDGVTGEKTETSAKSVTVA